MTSPADHRDPIAGVVVMPRCARVSEPVTFVGSGTTDPDTGDLITAYDWSFGDGGRASGVEVTHVFTTSGAHGATLTVTDSSGRIGTVRVPVIVLAPTSFAMPTTSQEAVGITS
jgi:PKD repeat protein